MIKFKPILFQLAIWVLLQSTALTAFAQAGYESISIAQGLSQGMVFDIMQDKDGFIWVATKNGLNRYDGYDFKVFTNDPYDDRSLSSNTILKLFEDSKGRIWIGTENGGLNIYDKKDGRFYRIEHRVSDPGSISGNTVKMMVELPDGRILAGIDEAGLNIIQLPEDFISKGSKPVITRLSLPNESQVYGLGRDRNNNVWVGDMEGLVYRFDVSKNNFIKLENGHLFNNGYVIEQDGNTLISRDLFLSDGKDIYPLFDIDKITPGNVIFNPRGKLWLNHHRELYFYDVGKWEPGKAIQWNKDLPENMSQIISYPFFIDRSGMLWCGTIGYGLRKYNTASIKFKTQLPEFSVRFIVPVSSNEMYVGNYAYGWRKVKKDSTVTDPFTFIPSVNEIDNFIVTSNGDFCIKSDKTGYYLFSPASGKLTSIPEINFYYGQGDKQPMMEDRKGRIWIPGMGGTIFLLDNITRRVDSFSVNSDPSRPMFAKAICTAMYEDKQGTFWYGTQAGFAKLVIRNTDHVVPQVKWYYNDNSNRNSLNYDHVSCFLDDPKEPDRYIWICTKGGGLNRLDKTTGNFIHLTTKDGLPDDVVYGILADDAGNIWGSTNRGIFCLLAENKNNNGKRVFRNFTKAYGLQDNEFNTGAYMKLPDGNLAFGGVNGLNIFNPKEILSKGFEPGVFVTNIMVNNIAIVPGDETGVLKSNIEETSEITLNYKQDILTLEFASLDFTAPNQNKYRYKLEGADKNWVESGERRTATYLHLPPGSYTFKVQGSNSQGIWSRHIASLQIHVLPPWWKTWWAYITYALLLLLAIRAYFLFSVNRAKLKSQLSFEQREARRIKEIDSLKTQLYTNITHEFRTPLTVILGMANQVLKNPAEHFNNGMNMIIRNGESLLKLVNEMLDLSKLETGKMSLQLSKGDIINFLRYIVESFNSLADSQHKQLHFLSDIDSFTTMYDAEKMRQIISNLLSNALKFTPEKGNVYIHISEDNLTNPGTAMLVIRVKDTGIGIPADQLQQVFDRFYQADNSQSGKIGGTGIGLALTKELVKLMDGDITVKSPPTGSNKGAEFTVMIPVKKPEPSAIIIADAGDTDFIQGNVTLPVTRKDEIATPGEMNSPLILLVEDNADVVAYTASCLPEYRLAVGKDGREGFEIATQIIPDLIITDIMMPFVDGFEMSRKLRSDERTSHIPIIMLTAKTDIESRIEGLELGADAYLEKPFHKEELLVRVRKLLELRLQLQQYYSRITGVSKTTGNDVVLDSASLPAALLQTEDAFVKKVRTAIEEHITDVNFNVEQLCKRVFMSHSQLHRKLDAVTGCSPNKFIRIIRLERAKVLLRNTNESVASVALECGYNDPGYFTRVFKQEFAITPLEWRAMQS
ncbi:MAG: helix-turn-helix domain-containing protein [Bacteroidetes bacterium]|nr:helix-turn-helix domain-containing protein [Bacteroidota bacterium]